MLSITYGSGIIYLMRGLENFSKFSLSIPRDTNNFEIIWFNPNFFSRICSNLCSDFFSFH